MGAFNDYHCRVGQVNITALLDALPREQKEEVILQRMIAVRPDVDGEIASVRFDRRFSFAFEVVRGPAGKARVTFSVPISAGELFERMVADCAQAVWDIRFTKTTVHAIRRRGTPDGGS